MYGALVEIMTPGEVADHLRVSAPTVRRMAKHYEEVFGVLPRDERDRRLWPLEAVRRVQAAHQALGSGRLASLERALELVRDGEELPQRVTLPVERDVLVELLEEVRALRALTEAQGRELAHLREVVQGQGRELPPATAQAVERTEEVRGAVREEVQAALDPERLRVALHASTPPPRRPSGWRGVLAALVAGRSQG